MIKALHRKYKYGRRVASFPGLPTVQFLIACSMQKWRGKAWSIVSHEWCQCLPRDGGVLHPHSNDTIYQAFPSLPVFAYYKRSKTRGWEGLRTRLSTTHIMTTTQLCVGSILSLPKIFSITKLHESAAALEGVVANWQLPYKQRRAPSDCGSGSCLWINLSHHEYELGISVTTEAY